MKTPVLPLLAASVATLNAAVSVDFSGPTDFADNFRRAYVGPSAAPSAQVGGSVATIASASTPDNSIYIYDTTPADAAAQTIFNGASTISFDIRTVSPGSSFGIFIINPSSEASSSHFLALFNWDVSGANDRLRLFSGNTITGTGVGTVRHDGGTTANSGLDAGSAAFTTATLTYSQGANNAAVLNFTVGSLSSGNITLPDNSYIANYEVGLRSYDAGTGDAVGTDFDNFNVSVDPIPEPSALLLASAALPLAWLRRRKSK